MLKKIILGLILLEVLNFGFELLLNGKAAFLPYTEFNAPALYYDMDSLYGVIRQKNTKQIINYPWGGIPYNTNKLGFRDDKFQNNGVLFVGNSFVEGFGVNTKNRFTELLEKDLNIVINNSGSGGVWSAIQSLVLVDNMIKEYPELKKVIVILTPGEILNIDTRNPKNDPFRNFPYKKNDSIAFHKASNNSFQQQLSLVNKIKRFSKGLLISKIYTNYKYYGSAKVKKTTYDLDEKSFEWLLNRFNALEQNIQIDLVVLNNLGSKNIKNIRSYKKRYKHMYVIDFPDDYSNYFVSNGHLNKKGNLILSKLLLELYK